MRINIQKQIGRYDEPATVAVYREAKFEKNKVTLTGIATCQGRSWDVEHIYYIPENLKNVKKDEILKEVLR